MESKKNLFVFGGSKGIGGVFTKNILAQNSYDVTLFSRSNPYKFDVDFREVDFCKQSDFISVLKDCAKKKEKIHSLVFFLKYRGSDLDITSWEGEILVELETIKNTLEILDAYLVYGASIVFTSSVVGGGLITINQPIEYHVAKAGLEQMVRYYAVNLGKRNIRVNAVAPSLTLKPENMEFYNNQKRLVELYCNLNPLGKMGRAEDIVEVILFLMKVKFMTGQILRVDGGVSLQEYEWAAREIAAFYNGEDLQE